MSCKASGELTAPWALPDYFVFKSQWVRRKISQDKNRIKQTNGINNCYKPLLRTIKKETVDSLEQFTTNTVINLTGVFSVSLSARFSIRTWDQLPPRITFSFVSKRFLNKFKLELVSYFKTWSNCWAISQSENSISIFQFWLARK